jgi:hypothetical protein
MQARRWSTVLGWKATSVLSSASVGCYINYAIRLQFMRSLMYLPDKILWLVRKSPCSGGKIATMLLVEVERKDALNFLQPGVAAADSQPATVPLYGICSVVPAGLSHMRIERIYRMFGMERDQFELKY